jgi:DMSO reductase family type II enzyme chaperone
MKPIAELENIEGPEQHERARRSQMYRFLAESFRYPDKEFLNMARDSGFLESALAILHDIPYEVAVEEGALSGRLLEGVSQDDFEAEFVRVFEAGPKGPLCPLYEGHYAGNRMGNMEELVRFYNHFGLSVAEAPERELPDHITTELEFLHYLAFKEVLALQRGEDPAPYCSAEIDFLKRHPAKWLPQLHKKTEDVFRAKIPNLCEPALSFYCSLLGLSANFCEADLAHLQRLYPDRK